MVESFDRGQNWSDAIRINDDPIGNNKMQDLLWADFDYDGDLVVSWRDRRNGSNSGYQASSEIWGALRMKDSTDFSLNFKISNGLISYDTILAYAGNDFMCINFTDDTLNAVWGDTREGKLNIWFQRMGLDGAILSTHKISKEYSPDITIFPNPFESFIKIKGNDIIQVELYNQKGQILSKYKNLKHHPEINLDLTVLQKGVYIFLITTKYNIISKKVIKF